MKRPPSRKWLFIAALGLASGGVWHQIHPQPVETRGKTIGPPAAVDRAPDPPGRPEHERQISSRLSLDECWARQADGTLTLRKLDPPATRGTLRRRLEALNAFPAVSGDEEREHRVATRDMIVEITGDEQAVLARNPQLVVKRRPEYAPGWLVLQARDSVAAFEALAGLRATTGVAAASVALARQQTPKQLPDDPLIGNQWHLKTSGTASPGTSLNVESVWNYGGGNGTRGAGIRIGIVDDGLEQTHEDLIQNADSANGWDWNDNDSDPSPAQADRHGTACAGAAAARGNNALGGSGVAPEATLVGLRLIAAPSTDEQEADAMLWKKDLIQVKNNSWGPSDNGTTLEGPGPLTRAALQAATATGRGGLGTIFVWAAGNGQSAGDNSNYDGYANSIHTIATGAVDSTGNAAYYSESGANLVVCAPSDGSASAPGITTTDLSGGNGYNSSASSAGGDYTDLFGGTSAATPLVAGVVALMLEKNPLLGWRDVQEILIRSATRIRPTDSGWALNGAGIAFHPRFGAGFANASAAVAMAAGWENLPAHEIVSRTAAGPVAIPDNTPAGISIPFSVSDANLRVEHVTVTVDIAHTSRGNLEVVLTSPSGTVSRLAEVHSDTNDHFQWTFSSVRHWAEGADGTWTLRISDRSTNGNTTGGTLHSASLGLYGSAAEPRNPPPSVAITSPADSSVFTPGATVAVEMSAHDLTLGGTPGTVAEVVLIDNGTPVATLDSPPYHFLYQPSSGPHTLVARATDDEGATADSPPVSITLENRPPAISSVHLNAFEQAYADRALRVQSVAAVDPDAGPLSTFYQWQSGTDGLSYQDAAGETSGILSGGSHLAGRLWRCVVTVSDGQLSSAPFISPAVNLITRPETSVSPGSAYTYQSGLVLAGNPVTLNRRAIIHEFSQGPAGGNSEWVEILVLKQTDMGYWDLSDTTNTLVFKSSGIWNAIPAGTLIVVYNGNTVRDPILPADDPDPADRRMVVSSTNPTFFETSFDPWIPLSNSGDRIVLKDAASVVVHSLSYGNGTGSGPHLGTIGSATAAFFAGDAESPADTPAGWLTTAANGAVTPGAPNNPTNANFISSVKAGSPASPARFSPGSASVLPQGLSLDPVSGLLSGTVAPEAAAGSYEIHIERTNTLSGRASQSYILTVGSTGGYSAWIAGFPSISPHSPGADPDGDGRPNLTEYALGSSPALADRALQLTSSPTGISLGYSSSRLHSNVELIPEWSTGLDSTASWQETGIDIQLLHSGETSREWRAILAVDPAQPRRFLRLKAIRVP